MENYISGKKASEILGVHQRTLMNWDKKGLIDVIRTPGNKRLYNVKKYLEKNKFKCDNSNLVKGCDFIIDEINEKIDICYIRVSTYGQKDDLERQKQYMIEQFPNLKIIEDVGSGINFKRKGLLKIIQLAIDGKLNKLIVAHKDRLARFGYELIDFIIKEYSNGEIIILNKEEDLEPEEEMVKDVLQIMNVFTAKMNGLRKYKKNKD
jgi:predicted site-specific integrase-resolvase